MRGLDSECITLPEPSGSHDESFSYSLTPAGRRALAEFSSAAERHARRARAKRRAREHGRRCGTVSNRWRETKYVPQVRLSGAWLRAAGFDFGQCFEVGVEEGALVIRVV